jgi:hypothetical protein
MLCHLKVAGKKSADKLRHGLTRISSYTLPHLCFLFAIIIMHSFIEM